MRSSSGHPSSFAPAVYTTSPTRRARHPTRGAALSYARIFLGTVILIAVAFYLLKVTIVAAIFGVFALIVLIIVLKEGL